MAYVYIIACNEERGIEMPWFATLDRSQVIPLFEKIFDPHPYEDRYGWTMEKTRMIDPVRNLTEVLAKSDEELSYYLSEEERGGGAHQFMPGWGGPMLYVIRLS